MILGDVYFWSTDKAKGYDWRDKYHLFICGEDWELPNTFLFISSENYEGDYKIYNPPYKFLPKAHSFVSCGSIVTYQDDELSSIGEKVGKIDRIHLLELHAQITSSFTMEGRHAKRVCNAIYAGCYGP